MGRLRRFLRYPYALLRDAVEGQLTMRAMSLVYSTLLSIVPLIALSFSLLKAFDVHYQIEPLINQFLAPLGPRAPELTARIIDFVENVRGVALGSVGLALLIFTVVTMIQKVEESLNYVWQVERHRGLAHRLSGYLSMIVMAPLLVLVALSLLGTVAGASTALMRKLVDAQWIDGSVVLIGELTPYLIVLTIFSFIYGLVPNTRVRPLAALVGGVTAGVLWASTGALFASFVASSTRYTAIYSTFAIAVLALFWLYISWLILLIGAKISFYFQHPVHLREGHRPLEFNNALRERLAVSLMAIVGKDFHDGEKRWTINELAGFLGLPGRGVSPIAGQLEAAGLLVATEEGKLLPGRALDTISVADILGTVRLQPSAQPVHVTPARKPVSDLLERLEAAIDGVASDVSLKTLVAEQGQENQSATVEAVSTS